MRDADRFERLHELFTAARALRPQARDAFLADACQGDDALRREVEALLRNDRDGESWVPPIPAAAALLRDDMPERIGPYRVVALLGEGGMGRVYLAEQERPVRRRVAVKVVKLGMDSKAVLARFELERQALAMMNHDAIARVYDCGTTERGQPFFVMELVEGEPLTSYCDHQGLSLPERIELFEQVCHGVQHAHQKGVVHRDLKPGNVLAARFGERHVVKIIDFGVARATDQQFVDGTMFTEQGALLGTPDYMSPEQADPLRGDIDTRTDVYSLGVMLYELLCGVRPFPSAQLREAGLLEVQRILREVEAPRPSTRIDAGDEAATAAQARRTTVGVLRKALRDDLDWVVLKAIEKDRDRRYETAAQLAADLRRFLGHEPLVAGPPTAGYRLRKLLRRHRGQAAAAGAVLLTAFVGAAFAMYYLGRLDKKAAEFDLLAAGIAYRQVVAAEQELYPAWPHRLAELETWLSVDCRGLLATRAQIDRTLANLRAGAGPWTQEQQRRDLEQHERHGEWLELGHWLASMRRAAALRAGGAAPVLPELTAAQRAMGPRVLNHRAYDYVAPPPFVIEVGRRRVHGQEALGLAMARAAAAAGEERPDAHRILDTLAWALMAHGLDEEARRASDAAVARAPERERGMYRSFRERLEYSIEHAAELLAETEAAHAALTAEVTRRRTWQLEHPNEQFLHDTLAELQADLLALERDRRPAVEERVEWARRIAELTRAHPNARVTWADVRAAIGRSPLYAGQGIELRDEDVVGLVPIGRNPVTGYQEFYHLRSAWDGEGDPASLPIPEHDPDDGSIVVTEATGIVFVLLPGGTFRMGATLDPDDPNHDPDAEQNEAPHEITLAPFFLARHELTQGQWRRLWSGDRKLAQPSGYPAGSQDQVGGLLSWTNPVENVDWTMADTIMRQHMLTLPTEAQWEYGCRAGSSGPFCCATEELVRFANLSDTTAGERTNWLRESWSDGHAVHAPVGSFAANAFGLYDVHGNVWEWCRDVYAEYDVPVAEGDGLLLASNASGEHIARGGCFDYLAIGARSAMRDGQAATVRESNLGLRAARALRPLR